MAWKKKFTPEEKAAYHKQKQEDVKMQRKSRYKPR